MSKHDEHRNDCPCDLCMGDYAAAVLRWIGGWA